MRTRAASLPGRDQRRACERVEQRQREISGKNGEKFRSNIRRPTESSSDSSSNMSECVESVHATDASPVKDSAKISEKVICEEDCVKSKKDENEVDGSQQVKRKSLDDGKREDEVTKKPKKDDAEDEAGDEEATSVNTDEEDGVEKETEGAEDVGEEEDSAGDEPAS